MLLKLYIYIKRISTPKSQIKPSSTCGRSNEEENKT
jgi:hypothetical protein